MALILALILIVILCSKVSSDKAAVASSGKSAEERYNEYEERRDEWVSEVTDRKLEYDITRMVEQKSEAVNQELLIAFDDMKSFAPECLRNAELVDDTVLQLVQEKFEQVKTPGHLGWMCYYSKYDVTAIRVMLANRGKLRVSDATYGMEWTCDCNAPLYEDRLADYYKSIVFIRWIDKKLQEHGIHEQLFRKGFTEAKCKVLDDEPYGGGISGFMWEPSVLFK